MSPESFPDVAMSPPTLTSIIRCRDGSQGATGKAIAVSVQFPRLSSPDHETCAGARVYGGGVEIATLNFEEYPLVANHHCVFYIEAW